VTEGAIVCIVGNRIGPRCLETVLAHRYSGEIIVGATPRADLDRIKAVVASFGTHAPVVPAEQALQMVASGGLEPRWLLNLWGELIIPSEVLAQVRGSLNIHPSLLPWARGSDPVVWTIVNQWPAGATLHVMSNELDAGPLWAQREVSYSFPCRGGDLYAQVLEACIELFEESWPRVLSGAIVPTNQGVPPAPAARRRDLHEMRVIQVDGSTAALDRSIVARLMAYDFAPDFSAQLQIGEDRYCARLVLTPADADAEDQPVSIKP
jgi:hypothetical protein